MMKERREYILDARNFQRYGEHDLALQMLEKAREICTYNEDLAEIEHLKSFSYRKLEEYKNALDAINKALDITIKIGGNKGRYGVYLMNKGIVLECLQQSAEAVSTYKMAINIFRELYNNNKDEKGLLINSLITLALLYDNNGFIEEAKTCLVEAKNLFEGDEKEDRRYYSIINTLAAYEKDLEGEA